MVANADWWLNKVIMVTCAFIMGNFFTCWMVDFAIMWSPSSTVTPAQLDRSLAFYHMLVNAPPLYWTALAGAAGLALCSCAIKVLLNPLRGMLFDGASLMLMISGLSVHTSNFRAALDYLPLPGTRVDSLVDSFKLKDALLTLASSNMIIAVTLTGVLAIQSAQGFANRTPHLPTEVVATK
ncbi:hypothetical protein OIV83_002635 [Microbotryomycetes sp. JL201]|nr:hypothetical protein OIV83_002635 [Microbotryomycetes sp. JL201]